MLKAKNLSKTYYTGEVATRALVDASFQIPEGQYTAITGKSGSGKSTLLHLMSLLDAPTSGTAWLDNIDMNTIPPGRQTEFRLHRFGFVFQDYALLGELTATDNVMVPLLMQGLPTDDARLKAHKVLERLGLGERFENRPSQLSGGEQQRVSVARAIAHDPEIVFADEPTANLDSETSQLILDYFRELNNNGQTIIMITHETEYARQTDRIIHMADGEITEDEQLK